MSMHVVLTAHVSPHSEDVLGAYGLDLPREKVMSHPLLYQVNNIVAGVFKTFSSGHVEFEYFAGDWIKVMPDFIAYTAKIFKRDIRPINDRLRSWSDYNRVNWYGYDVRFLRKILWASCVRWEFLNNDKRNLETLYGGTSFELDSLLEIKKATPYSHSQGVRLLMPGDTEASSAIDAYINGDFRTPSLIAANRHICRLFQLAGAMPYSDEFDNTTAEKVWDGLKPADATTEAKAGKIENAMKQSGGISLMEGPEEVQRAVDSLKKTTKKKVVKKKPVKKAPVKKSKKKKKVT